MFTRRTTARFLPQRGTRRAVSLSEVLVVASLVMFMLALLVPSLSEAKERARRIQCSNNLRQWGLANRYYRDDHGDYLPTEGTYLAPDKPYTWFNVLPPYLNAPPYREVEGVGDFIKEFPELHVWICPSKNLSRLHKSGSGKNQFHYGMNEVLDGMNSALTPDFPDQGETPIRAIGFTNPARTVFMFDIYGNDSRGHQDDVATSFHQNSGNVLFLDGAVAGFHAVDSSPTATTVAVALFGCTPICFGGIRRRSASGGTGRAFRGRAFRLLIGIMSDSHGRYKAVRKAIDMFDRLGAAHIVHCGDVGGPPVFDELVGRQLSFVWGNMDFPDGPMIEYLCTVGLAAPVEPPLRLQLDGKTLAVFHGHEPDFTVAMKELDVDYLLHGHTHVARDERLNGKRVINPGALFRTPRKTVATLDTDTDTLTFHDLKGA